MRRLGNIAELEKVFERHPNMRGVSEHFRGERHRPFVAEALAIEVQMRYPDLLVIRMWMTVRGVDPRLPAGSGGAEALDDIGVEAERDELLRGFGLGAARPPRRPDQLLAEPDFGVVEKLVRQLRNILVFLRLNFMGVQFSQV